uniref:Uncharacterized protein n=1 Tax=Anopheles atroparvus TaxID=41427 RepID=A0A182IY44_ANOAO
MLLQTLGYDAVWLYSISIVVMVSMITAVLSCLCCRRKQEIKNDLLGLEGMVKLTNPEDALGNTGLAGSMSNPSPANGALGTASSVASDFRPASAGGMIGPEIESSSKRTSNAPHRSLPDIPIAEPAGDNNSELYATVTQAGNSAGVGGSSDGGPSGLSSRAKPRDGDEEDDEDEDDDELMSPISRRESTQNLEHRETSTVDIPAASAIAGRVSASQDLPYMTPPIVQPSAQHFSGDSQDSSKGYTSISVREPLANLLPQNLPNQATAKRRQILGDSHYATVSDDSDEMYAAIDDPNNQADLYTSGSETYAQIQPPNAVTVSVEINTGASSRPQTAPMPAVHPTGPEMPDAIATGNSDRNAGALGHPASSALNRLSNHSNTTTSGDEHMHGMLPAHLPPATAGGDGGLRAQSFVQHSRQASSSSCTSSVGNLGSPKPEKRQANSPLPPTPKTLKHQANNFFSNSNQSMLGVGSVASSSSTTVGSGRNSAASVIEHGVAAIGAGVPSSTGIVKAPSDTDGGTMPNGSAGGGGNRPKKSPSKDLEGMYAKVMKKNKLSKVPSQNSSPVALRKDGSTDEHYQKHQQFLSESDMSQLNGSGPPHGGGSPSRKAVHGEGGKQRANRNSAGMYDSKDPGYETIPGDGMKGAVGVENARKSADYAQIQKLHRSIAPGTGGSMVASLNAAIVAQADSEPGYESLPDRRGTTADPGYETLNRGSERTTESDSDPNYEILRPAAGKTVAPMGQTTRVHASLDGSRDSDGYSSIREPGRLPQPSKGSARNRLSFGGGNASAEDDDTDSTPGYSSIKEKEDYDPGYSVISERKKPPLSHDYASITEDVKKRKPNINNNLVPDEESDIYSSIPHTASGTLTLPSPVASATPGAASSGTGTNDTADNITPYASIPERPNVGNPLCATLSSSPGYSSISETRTTPSSTDGDGDGSTSSPDQLIGYNKHNNTNTTVTTTNSLSRISSNYESLTGSESDPNYESVKYLNVTENPYERLHNEAGGAAVVGSNASVRKSITNESLTTDSDTATPTPNIGAVTVAPPGRTAGTPDSDGAAPAVGDYFQV